MAKDIKERRQFFRHPIQVPIRLKILDQDQVIHSASNDLSLGGLNFSWSKKLSKGTLLSITIPVRDKFFDLRAKVVFCRENKKTAYYHTGVTFTDFPSAFKARLAEEVLQIMEFQKNISRESGVEISEEEAAARWVKQYASEFPAIT